MLKSSTTFILCFFFGFTLLMADPLEVSFSADTLHACQARPFVAAPVIQGGIGPFNFLWQDSSMDSTLVIIPTQTYTTLEVVVTDAFNEKDTARLVVYALTECVFPGDANGDGVANNLDLINLGLAFGESGYQRPNAHLNWVGQPAHSWSHNFSNGINYAHVDGDGNGLLNAEDILAISHNYLVPNTSSTEVSSQGVPLFVEFNSTNAQPGDTVRARVMIGSSNQPADSLYGIAFSLELTGYEIDSGSLHVSYNQSILGGPSDILTIDKAFYDQTRVEIGITRFDGNEVAGMGQLAEIIVVIDEIIGKRKGIDILDFNLKNVSINSGSGSEIQVNPSGSGINIVTKGQAYFNEIPVKISTLQNKGWLVDLGSNTREASTLSLYALNGALLYTHAIHSNKHFIPTTDLNSGLYILEIKGKGGQFHKKLMKK